MGLFGKRIIAFYIDAFIAFFIIIAPLYLIAGMFEININPIFAFIAAVLGTILLLFKDISGRSVGKRIMGLKLVIKADSNTKPKWQHLVLRNILLGLWAVDAIRLLYGYDKILDKLLGIKVVETHINTPELER